MGFRFFKRVKIAPGVTLNLSKTGGSISVGPRGAKLTVSPKGARATAGLPGTGLSYTTHTSFKGKAGKSRSRRKAAAVPNEDQLNLGFFQRLVTPVDEEALVDGLKNLTAGQEGAALERFQNATHLADGALLAGLISLRMERLEPARQFLELAVKNSSQLGKTVSKYHITAAADLAVTDEITVHVGFDRAAALLALAEAYQALGEQDAAVAAIRQLMQIEPDDVLVRLSLAELLCQVSNPGPEAMKEVVKLCEGLTNASPVHGTLRLYHGRALRQLGLNQAAADILGATLRATKGRPPELLLALRYERALAWTEIGRAKAARAELEKIYAQDPGFEHVAQRLGL